MADLVTAQEIKDYAQINHSDHDTFIQGAIGPASEEVIDWLGQPVLEEEKTEFLDGGVEELIVSSPPINSVTKIVDTDPDPDETVEADQYDHYSDQGAIFLVSDNDIGSTWDAGKKRWKVVYKAGSAGSTDIDDVPKPIKDVVIKLIYNDLTQRDKMQSQERGVDHQHQYRFELTPRMRRKLTPYRADPVSF